MRPVAGGSTLFSAGPSRSPIWRLDHWLVILISNWLAPGFSAPVASSW